MNRKSFIVAISILTMLSWGGITLLLANMRSSECRYIYRTDEAIGEWNREIFDNCPDVEAVEVCEVPNGSPGYSILSKIIKNEGVSSYSKERIFRLISDSGVTWSTTPPPGIPSYRAGYVEYMSLDAGETVSHEDPSFLMVKDVDREAFKQILTGWERIVGDKCVRTRTFGGISLLRRWERGVRSLENALERGNEVSVESLFKLHQHTKTDEKYHLFVKDSENVWRIEIMREKKKIVFLGVGTGAI